jgi:hypothetical protein
VIPSFRETLREASNFFAERGRIYDALRKITRVLRDEDIGYAVVGGIALVVHGYRRFTIDVDLLTTVEGFHVARERLVDHGYVVTSPNRLLDPENHVNIDFIIAGEVPDVVEHDGYHVVVLPKLIEMKLVCGRRPGWLKHAADVQELIKTVKLPRELGEQLDPSVRDEYYRIWEESQIIHDPSAN